jgi:hypothetical protein
LISSASTFFGIFLSAAFPTNSGEYILGVQLAAKSRGKLNYEDFKKMYASYSKFMGEIDEKELQEIFKEAADEDGKC